jgi:hypothetical protein
MMTPATTAAALLREATALAAAAQADARGLAAAPGTHAPCPQAAVGRLDPAGHERQAGGGLPPRAEAGAGRTHKVK